MSGNYGGGQLKAPILKTENLSERVVLWLKQAILDGEFHPGDELPSEAEMCALLGVGKSSIREALKMLQMIGVVEIRQGKRSRICSTLKPDIMMPLIFNLVLQGSSSRELYDFRIMFEQAVIEFAMDRATDEDIRKLREEIDRFRDRCEKRTATVADDSAFHWLLLDICGNSFITQIGSLLLEIFEAPMKSLESYDAEQALRDHELVLQAFCSGDKASVKEMVRTSFQVYHDVLGIRDEE
ncbi:MAG: FadR family transcriptional regulator [Lachnospiraceae bacterium]|nr:FadR family transcriptional regulator [Lachnospiraceae bacterium]